MIFYGVTLGRKDLPERIPYARRPKSLPVVLSAGEVARLIEAVEDPVFKALATVYATGMRTAEVLSLRIDHIESARMLLRVEQGKGRRPVRHALPDAARYSAGVVADRQAGGWLFPGQTRSTR